MSEYQITDTVTFRSMYVDGPSEITGQITDSWKREPGLVEGETVYRVTYRRPWIKGTCAFGRELGDQHVTADRIIRRN